MIIQLDYSGIKTLYNARINRDFPRLERRPLFVIRRLVRQGRYICLVLFEKGKITAYATFICDKGADSVLLDHFAVDKNLRGNGVGSRFLSMLRDY